MQSLLRGSGASSAGYVLHNSPRLPAGLAGRGQNHAGIRRCSPLAHPLEKRKGEKLFYTLPWLPYHALCPLPLDSFMWSQSRTTLRPTAVKRAELPHPQASCPERLLGFEGWRWGQGGDSTHSDVQVLPLSSMPQPRLGLTSHRVAGEGSCSSECAGAGLGGWRWDCCHPKEKA